MSGSPEHAPLFIHWFRRDIRVSDNTALAAALNAAHEHGGHVLPIFIFDPKILQSERFGLRRMALMLKGLNALDAELKKFGGALHSEQGDPHEVLSRLVEQLSVKALFFNRDYSPYAVSRDRALEKSLLIPMHGFDDVLLHAPGEVLKSDGEPYVVFSPFRRGWLALPKGDIVETKLRKGLLYTGEESISIPTLRDLGFDENPETPDAGERVVQAHLAAFIEKKIDVYDARRNALSSPEMRSPILGTSFLSPYLRVGMLSPRQAYHAASEARAQAPPDSQHAIDVWVTELIWRDFYAHILYQFPHVYQKSFKPEYERVAFRDAPDELERWKTGQTGYPVVDAAMRQMQSIGWMHNRARMIVGSFLTKDLLIYWRAGDVIFMNHLMDGDPAANNGGWQWVAGVGTDPQPYFRIFNPITQSEKFDPNGDYIRHFVPELRDVPTKYIHTPWEMPVPPANYPAPMVDHAMARQRTMDAFKAIREKA